MKTRLLKILRWIAKHKVKGVVHDEKVYIRYKTRNKDRERSIMIWNKKEKLFNEYSDLDFFGCYEQQLDTYEEFKENIQIARRKYILKYMFKIRLIKLSKDLKKL